MSNAVSIVHHQIYFSNQFKIILCLHQMRNKAIAWRPLAYIPDQDMYYSKVQQQKMAAALKLLRLFKLYSVALKLFIEAQQNGALENVYLVLGDKAKYVTLKIPLAFIIV